jgi:uncharacterized protein
MSYLGAAGCPIHHRAPALCRDFDCRTFFVNFSRNERGQIERVNGKKSRDIFAAGRKRLDTR